jgi:hypothetical protein
MALMGGKFWEAGMLLLSTWGLNKNIPTSHQFIGQFG